MDTHTFIWYVTDDAKLSNSVKQLINDENNAIFLSLASIWEIGIKQSIGKLTFNCPFEIFITQQIIINEFSLLEIKIQHINIVSQLPLHHRDPFDRMLIAQAITENLPILSADTIFDNYCIQRLW